MGLTCKEYLEATDLFCEGTQAALILEKEASAFVSCYPPGKAKSENGRVEVMAGGTSEPGEEAMLVLGVTGGDARGINAVDGTEVVIVGTPVGNLLIEEFLEGWGEPGACVYTVGDGVDLVLGEHDLRDFAVLHGYAVDVAREV